TLGYLYPFTILDVNPQVDESKAKIRINGGSWITGLNKSVLNGKINLVGFNSSVTNGSTYEYLLYDLAGNLLQWIEGTVGTASTEQANYTYDRTYDIEHIVEIDSDWNFTRQITDQSSSKQVNYTQRLLHTIVTGTPVEKVIHNTQQYNAFGEIAVEIDGRGYQTDLRYDSRGQLVQKISPETDAWNEALAAQWASNPSKHSLAAPERTRPTENYFYDAAGHRVGNEDANGNRSSHILTNGRVEQEFFADGSGKSYVYDRLGDQRLEVDQLGRAITRQYDANGHLTEVERHVGVEAGNDLYFSGIRFDRWSHTRRASGGGENPVTTTTTHYLKITLPTLKSKSNVRVKIVDAGNHGNVFGDYTLSPGSSRQFAGYRHAAATYVYLYQDGHLVHEGAVAISSKSSASMSLPLALTYSNVDSYVDRIGYDNRGNRLWHENAHGNRERYYYDAEGRVTRYVSAAGRETLYDYQYLAGLGDGVLGNTAAVGGVQTMITNANGDTLVDRHSHFGKLVYHEDLGGHEFNYSYNTAGWLSEQTGTTANAQGNDQHINYYYYDNGYLKEVVDIGYKRYALFQYDENGNRVSEYYSEVPFASGEQVQIPYQVATAEYDELNRVKRVYEADRYDIRYFYDSAGNRRRINSQYTDLLRAQSLEQDFYYRYDAMNRFVVTMGELDGNGNITHGNTGYTISYDAAGQRKTAESNLRNAGGNPVYSMERYTYDAIGTLNKVELKSAAGGSFQGRAVRINNALGQMSQYLEYNSGHSVVRHDLHIYDDDNKLLRQVDISDVTAQDTTSYNYLADGTLSQSYTRSLDGNGNTDTDSSRVWQTYSYAKWDSYKSEGVNTDGHLKGHTWKPGQSSYKYDANGHVREFYDHVEDRTIRYVNNHLGQVMKRYQVDIEEDIQQDPVIRRFFYLNGIGIGDQGTDEVPSRIDYAQVLASSKNGDGKRLHNDIRNRISPVTSADFDQNFRPVGPDYPSKTPGIYVANAGDSLQSVALSVWGDASLWYLIADANGITGDELTAGRRLSIPNVVTNIHSNSETFRPYDPSITMGDTSATLPDPVAKKKNDCGMIAQIIVIVVTVVVSAYFGPQNLTWGEAALSAAAGSVAGQAAGIALGLQEDFNWTQVAVAAVSAGAVNAVSKKFLENSYVFTQGAVQGGVQNAAAQGINLIAGKQDQFSWEGFGVAAFAGGVNGMGSETSGRNLDFGLRSGFVDTIINNAVFDKGDDEFLSFQSVAINAIGQAIGNSLVGQMRDNSNESLQSGDHEAENESYGYFDKAEPEGEFSYVGGSKGLGGRSEYPHLSQWTSNMTGSDYMALTPANADAPSLMQQASSINNVGSSSNLSLLSDPSFSYDGLDISLLGGGRIDLGGYTPEADSYVNTFSVASAAFGGLLRFQSAVRDIVVTGAQNTFIRITGGAASVPYFLFDSVDAAVAVQQGWSSRWSGNLTDEGAIWAVQDILAPTVDWISSKTTRPLREYSTKEIGDGWTTFSFALGEFVFEAGGLLLGA
ncbi:MAG: RHS repeat protein, partial [Gammaproteobacteria bacterium]|nr:RHS repeat protein [Gammaproteobacteria bacterium]